MSRLDEATAALDQDSEKEILENLRSCGIAMLIVTHRADTRQVADRELWIHNGHLIEQAAPDVEIEKEDYIGTATWAG
jgi:ABC-type bacteriocin/lantibiotic exporter with double-glycine peptidase domain